MSKDDVLLVKYVSTQF